MLLRNFTGVVVLVECTDEVSGSGIRLGASGLSNFFHEGELVALLKNYERER
jgi:hypothetical protein